METRRRYPRARLQTGSVRQRRGWRGLCTLGETTTTTTTTKVLPERKPLFFFYSGFVKSLLRCLCFNVRVPYLTIFLGNIPRGLLSEADKHLLKVLLAAMHM